MGGSRVTLGGGVDKLQASVAIKHPVISCLLIATETNRESDTSATCIRLQTSGAPHVPFEDLQIGPNKEPYKWFAYEKKSLHAVEGGVWLAGLVSHIGNRPGSPFWVNSVSSNRRGLCVREDVDSHCYWTLLPHVHLIWFKFTSWSEAYGRSISSHTQALHHTPGTLSPNLQVSV